MNSSSSYSQYFPQADLSKPISLTYADAQTLSSSNLVKNGQLYHITDASNVDLGVIITGMPDGKSYSIAGQGGFLNADFQNIGNYAHYEGSNAGIWSLGNEEGYNNNTIVIWDNKHFLFMNGINGWSIVDGTYPKDDNSNGYQLLTKTIANGYVEEWDAIEYDFANNWIQSREDKRGNKMKMSFTMSQEIGNGDISFTEFQWGNNKCFDNKVFDSRVTCINNLGTISGCEFTGRNCTVGANLANNRGLFDCKVHDYLTSFDNIVVDYTSKTLSPSVSTFDAIIDCNFGGGTDTLTVPDYLGEITIYSDNTDNTINSFDTAPTFERRFTLDGGGNACSFDNSSNIILPTPSTITTLNANGADFIKFLWVNNNFIQTASEQY